MVFFTCNGCNESLKKNQCEKHIAMCRRAQSLSCVDCGKDFWGKDYQAHVKCISEEEKYSGKDYKPKANANKGEKKQEQWISQVQAAIERASTSPQLCSVLQRLLTYTNIPRTKAKFENFIRNSMKLHNEKLIAQMWAVLEENKPAVKAPPSAAADKAQSSSAPDHAPSADVASSRAAPTADSEAADADVTAVKLSKREKKEARKQHQHKREKKDKAAAAAEPDEAGADSDSACPARDGADQLQEDGEEAAAEESGRQNKKKKRLDRTAEVSQHETGAPGDGPTHKKKRKHRDEAESAQGDENCEGDGGAQRKKRKAAEGYLGAFEVCPLNEPLQDIPNTNGSKKYSIPEACLAVVRKHGEISLKKLKKKVVADYLSNASTAKYHTEEKLSAKIEKKVKSNPELVLHRDTVKLRSRD